MRDQLDDSGAFLLRRVEIKREPGQSLGFYICEGDGWLRKDGIFVSRVNLGSSVDVNGLLSVGNEIIRVNNVDVTQMQLDDVVLVMQFIKRMILTVKILTTFGFSSDLTLHKSLLARELPKPPSLSSAETTSGNPSQQNSEQESPYSEVITKAEIEERKLRFRRLKDNSRANSMAKSTNFGESFMKKLDGSLAKVEDANVIDRGEAEINPYEEVSYDPKQELAKPVASITEEEISPYARVSLRTEADGVKVVVEVHPEKKAVGDGRKAAILSSSVYEEVELPDKSSKEKESPSRAKAASINPYEEISIGGPPSIQQLNSGDPDDPYEAIENDSHMKMDSLLALLHDKPVPSSSPVVKRRSDIVDEIVVSPDHVYALIDRTRKYSSSSSSSEEGGEGEKERNLSITTPPPAPTSPLPHDDSMSTLADIFSKQLPTEESRDMEAIGEMSSTSRDHVTSGDSETLVPKSSEYHDDLEYQGKLVVSTDEISNQLGDEGPAPPLPPPYVPDEGPPDTSDEDGDSKVDSEADALAGGLEAMPLVEIESPGEVEISTNRETSSLEAFPTTQQPQEQDSRPSTPDVDEELKEGVPSPLPDTRNADMSGSLQDVPETSILAAGDSNSNANRDLSRDSFSDLPPPPPPPTGPPEDEVESNEERYSSDQDSVKVFTLLDTNSPDDREGENADKSLSGTIRLRIYGLSTTSEKSRIFWSEYDVQKVTFVTAVDEKVKVTATVPVGERKDSLETDEYQFLLFKNTIITFSVNPVCLPTVSKGALLYKVFPTDLEGVKHVYIDFEAYGRLNLSLEHRHMNSVVRRMVGEGYSNPSFSDLVGLNPSNSGCPLVLEQCMEVIERYGLKTPHLYERCTPMPHKHRALAACVENLKSPGLKSVLVRCSVHAYTGLVIDFFRDLPEPFFSNDTSSNLTQSASVDGTLAVLEGFLLCLPDEVVTTLNLLLRHFRRIIEHSEWNGVTAKSIARLFGPLLLMPSLSPDLSISTTTLEYAEEYDAQATVVELLLSRKDT